MKASNKKDKLFSNYSDLLEHTIYKWKRFGESNEWIKEATDVSIEGYLRMLREKQSLLINADIIEL